jgi:hypothetical protein
MKHIYQCETINDGEQPVLKYEKIFEGNICEQIEVFRKFERNIENRKKFNELKKENIIPCDPHVIHCTQ